MYITVLELNNEYGLAINLSTYPILAWHLNYHAIKICTCEHASQAPNAYIAFVYLANFVS